MTDILRTRLEAIDAECESAAKIELDSLYGNAHYDDTKFHIPSPQAAEAIWLKLIACKENAFIQEMINVLKPRSAILSKEDASGIEKMIDDMFAEGRYLERMQDFYRKVVKRKQLHDPSFEMEAKRLELLDSTYRLGVTEALRKARHHILTELEPNKQLDGPEDTGFFSQWQHYSNLSPWRSITTIVLLSLTSYLIAFIIASDTFRGLLERLGWLGGTGL